MLQPNSSSTIKSLINKTLLGGHPLIELTQNHMTLISEALSSRRSKSRKMAAFLLIHLSNEHSFFLNQFCKNKLLHNFEGYTGVSLDYSKKLVDPREFIRLLKRDPNFLKEETKCNGFLIKYINKNQNPSKKKKRTVQLLTMTELKYHLEENEYQNIPDPLHCAIWFYKEQEKFIPTKLEFVDVVQKIKKKKLRRKIRRMKTKMNGFFSVASSGSKKLKKQLMSQDSPDIPDRERIHVGRRSFLASRSLTIGGMRRGTKFGGVLRLEESEKKISENGNVSPPFRRSRFLYSKSLQRKKETKNVRVSYSRRHRSEKQKITINRNGNSRTLRGSSRGRDIKGKKKKNFLINQKKGKHDDFLLFKKFMKRKELRRDDFSMSQESKSNESHSGDQVSTGKKDVKKKSFFFKISRQKNKFKADSDQ